jgi:hypothetical protein
MRIEITQGDIDVGHTNDCHRCPIALAMLRAGLWDVEAYPDELLWRGCRDEQFSIRTPEPVRVFMGLFDTQELVMPFWFDLDEEAARAPYEDEEDDE